MKDVQVVIRKAEKAVAEATATAAHKIPFSKKTSKEEEVKAGPPPAKRRQSSVADWREKKPISSTSDSNCDKPAVIKQEASSRAKTETKPDATAVKSIKKEKLESKYSTPNR